MKPPESPVHQGRPFPSPFVGAHAGSHGMPRLDLASARHQASAMPTQQATPVFMATEPEEPVPHVKLPAHVLHTGNGGGAFF